MGQKQSTQPSQIKLPSNSARFVSTEDGVSKIETIKIYQPNAIRPNRVSSLLPPPQPTANIKIPRSPRSNESNRPRSPVRIKQ